MQRFHSDMKDLLLKKIAEIAAEREKLIIAIDGRCASGKSTKARELQKELDCAVFHMDDFFLPPEKRTEERLSQPGGNVDYERFLSEVLQPLREEREVLYRPFSCKNKAFGQAVSIPLKKINIVEGSYSLHPWFWQHYDLRIFLDISPEEQLARIKNRSPEKLDDFINKWIPLEEKYFDFYRIKDRSDIVL